MNELQYEPTKTDLTDEHVQYLKTVSEMLIKKTELELHVCPFASSQEVELWGDSWKTKVAERAIAVKSYLAEIQDKDGNTLSGRITICTPDEGEQSIVILGV